MKWKNKIQPSLPVLVSDCVQVNPGLTVRDAIQRQGKHPPLSSSSVIGNKFPSYPARIFADEVGNLLSDVAR